MYVWIKTVYIEFGTICGFRHPPGVLEPDKGVLRYTISKYVV